MTIVTWLGEKDLGFLGTEASFIEWSISFYHTQNFKF